MVSGSALLVDYVLTIAVSLASCGDAVFSYLPTDWLPYKIYFGAFLVLVMLFLNLRKESGSFTGEAEIEALGRSIEEDLKKYVTLCRSHGYPADYRTDVGTEAVETATRLCEEVAKEFPRSTVFAGQFVFREETPFQKILHNETAFAIQRRLQWQGITAVILPVRVGA